MKRFFFYLFVCLFVIFVYFLTPSPSFACSWNVAYFTCSGSCSAGYHCVTVGWQDCYCQADPTPTPTPNLGPICIGGHCQPLGCFGAGGQCITGSGYACWPPGCGSYNAGIHDKCKGVETDIEECPSYYCGNNPACVSFTCVANNGNCISVSSPEKDFPLYCGSGSCSCGERRAQLICCRTSVGSFSNYCTDENPLHCGDVCVPDDACFDRPSCGGGGGPTDTPILGEPTETPTPTPTLGGPTNTPTPTPTLGGPTNTPTPTPTATPTPTPGPWTKLKNTSFSSINPLTSLIPLFPVAYDAGDDTSANFIVGEGGLVSAPLINLTTLNPSAQPSTNNWSVSYTPTYLLTPNTFLSYVKARKEYKSITSLDDVVSNGIYVYQGDLTLNKTELDKSAASKFVLIVNGNVTIDQGKFNSNDCTNTLKSIAVLSKTGTISFSDTTQCAAGIFIADGVDTGVTINQGLKIIGNLIAQTTFTNQRNWSNPNKPVLFVAFDQQQYIDLLPYLSTANYEWRQIQ